MQNKIKIFESVSLFDLKTWGLSLVTSFHFYGGRAETIMYWINMKMKVVDLAKFDGLHFLFTSNYGNK